MIRATASISLLILTMTRMKTNDLIKFALKLLSVRDYFSCEIAKKLEKKYGESENIQTVIEYLDKYKYLNDISVLSKYAQEVFNKLRGVNYLKKKLFDKGCGELFSNTEIANAYSLEMEKEAAEKLANSMMEYPVEKIVGRMKSRGFRTEVIYEVYARLKKS